jgi:hypothetical protein
MFKIRYTNNEDETAFVDGPRGTVMVCQNGQDYSVMGWSSIHRAFTKILINHAAETQTKALVKAMEFVR